MVLVNQDWIRLIIESKKPSRSSVVEEDFLLSITFLLSTIIDTVAISLLASLLSVAWNVNSSSPVNFLSGV